MPQNLSVPNSVRSVAGISAQSTGALTELKKFKFVFGIQIVYCSEILHEKYPKLEYWSDENPSVITSRWRKRHFGITLFENTNFSTFKFSFKIPKTPPNIGTFQNQKTRGGENGIIFPGGENGISRVSPVCGNYISGFRVWNRCSVNCTVSCYAFVTSTDFDTSRALHFF